MLTLTVAIYHIISYFQLYGGVVYITPLHNVGTVLRWQLLACRYDSAYIFEQITQMEVV